MQHWHLPQPRTPGQQRVVYSRAGRRGGMRQLVRELEGGPAQPGAASINSEDIIQVQHRAIVHHRADITYPVPSWRTTRPPG